MSLKKAFDLVANLEKHIRCMAYGAAKCVDHLQTDARTGEAFTTKEHPTFNATEVAEEERYDGYHAIVINELGMSSMEVIEICRGLWEIEETFRITKEVLETRPIFVSLPDHINARFLVCFLALIILRLLQKQTEKLYSAEKSLTVLNASAAHTSKPMCIYIDCHSEISDAIRGALSIDPSRKRLARVT